MTHDPTAYGRRIAGDYDALQAGRHDTAGAVELVDELAGAGPALELGVGTGRVALPLAARGVEVHGVDASPEMVELLRAKPGGDALPVTVADFQHLEIAELLGRCTVVLLLFNTVYALPDQAAQVACFRAAARHLRPGGRFVVEAWVPDRSWPAGPLPARTLQVGTERVVVEAAEHDPVAQTLRTTKVAFTDDGVRLYPANHRYAWPTELDLMAELAGMRMQSRWADWRRTPYAAHSGGHVTVYRLP